MSFSILFLATGAILLGFSNTAAFFVASMAIYTLGAGFGVTLQAYISSRIAQHNLAKVLAVLSFAATGGKVAASALWPVLLNAGLDGAADGGPEWLRGLPMFVFAGGFLVAGLGVGFVAFGQRKKSEEEVEDGTGESR